MTDGLQVHFLNAERFGLDGGAMFGIVPKPLWTKTNPADEANRIELTTRCLLIKHPSAGNILVDVGIGTKWDDKGRSIFNIRQEVDGCQLGIRAALAEHGLKPSDVDHVVMTHLHFDHAGGLTERDAAGELSPVFPQTPHYVLKEHWDWANAPSERDRGSFHPEDFAFLRDSEHLHLVEGMSEVFEGVTLIPRYGHTEAMAVVKVDTPEQTYLHLADLIPTAGHVRIPYVMGYDLDPRRTVREKRELLSEAYRHNWKLVFEHDPFCESAFVEPNGRGDYRVAR